MVLLARPGRRREGMIIPADALDRSGYRLPTEAEWEYACRAGAVPADIMATDRPATLRLVFSEQPRTRLAGGSLLPNDLGLFDMLGNIQEWPHDVYEKLPTGTARMEG